MINDKSIKDIVIVALVGLLGYCFLFLDGGLLTKSKNTGDTTLIEQKTTVYKDTTIINTISKPKSVTLVNHYGISDDSLLQILKKFKEDNGDIELDTTCKTLKAYNDTLQNDTNGLIVVNDTIQGQLLKRNKFISLYNTRTLVEKTISIKEKQLHLGVYVGIDNFAPTIMYTNKKNIQLGGSYDILQQQPNFYIGYRIK